MTFNDQERDLYAKIKEQIESYFDDVNLQHDTFLQDEMKKDDGWISIDVLLTLNPLNQITKDKNAVALALKDNKLIDVSEDGEKIRRKPESLILGKEETASLSDVDARTAFLKGFLSSTTLDEIMELLQPCGTIDNIIMHRELDTQAFKGSIFVIFSTKDDAESFVRRRKGVFWCMMKNELQNKKKIKKENKAVRAALKEGSKKQKKKKKDAHKNMEFKPVHFLKGNVMNVKNLPKNVDKRLIKAFFYQFSPVGYVESAENSTEANLRFNCTEENAAVRVLQQINQAVLDNGRKVEFLGKEIECKVLEGEEEERYWSDFNNSKFKKHLHGPKTKVPLKKCRIDNHQENDYDMLKNIRGLKEESGSSDAAVVQITKILKRSDFVREYRETLRALRNGRAKLVIMAKNAPFLRKQEIEYTAILRKVDVYEYPGNRIRFGANFRKHFGIFFLCITAVDTDVSEIIRSLQMLKISPSSDSDSNLIL